MRENHRTIEDTNIVLEYVNGAVHLLFHYITLYNANAIINNINTVHFLEISPTNK